MPTKHEPDPASSASPNLSEPFYLVLFKSSASHAPVPQVANVSSYDPTRGTFPYGFDRELVPALPALWYCLHLPRTRFDLVDVHAKAMKALQKLELPHRIVLLPVPWPEPLPNFYPSDWPTIILRPHDLRSEAEHLASVLPAVVDIADTAELGTASLKRHWSALYSGLRLDRPRYAWPSQLVADNTQRALLLPRLFVTRQLLGGQDGEALPMDLSKTDAMGYSTHSQIILAAIARLESEGLTLTEAEAIMPKAVAFEARHHRCPVALLLPGTSPATATRRVMQEWVSTGLDTDSMAEAEESALDFLVTHRAAARLGVSLKAASVSDRAFRMLDQLERMFQGRRVSPRKLGRQLARLSEEVVGGLTDEEQSTLLHASSITSFSEFPIGLVTLPPDTSPLCCRTPIAYRPLVPLTRALQFELHPAPPNYLPDEFSVGILECIPSTDLVGRLSRHGWQEAIQQFPTTATAKIEYIEIDSIESLRRALQIGKFQIAVISAHGVFDRGSNRTGLQVGAHELFFGDELQAVPPLVCLAACQVAPRGSGSVNISDLLFRQGAMAVLGTLVPVDVRRNAHLMLRFFLYLAESLAGRIPLRSIDEVWQFTMTSNAVLDIAYGSQRAANLMFSPWQGSYGLKDFMNNRSAGRLRVGHVYADTEAVMQEIANERGEGAAFESWLNNQGYVPESIFYVFLGWPERFVLRDTQFEEARRSTSPGTDSASPT